MYSPLPPHPYKIYPDLEEMNEELVQSEEDEELYRKSRLYGCRNCDLVSENRMYLIVHSCSNNGKSKYNEHQMDAFNRKIERLNKNNK
jgi:hypothetical protein